MNIADYVEHLQTLTQKNLEILQAINNSFFTKQEHIQVQVGDSRYVIPSFISLENKINSLQENFENLVYAPKSGEAVFNMDGNTRHLEMRGYTCTPERVSINIADINGFSVEQNDIFKDMLTPNPYIKINLSSIPNDIQEVNVRKIAFKSDELKQLVNTELGQSSLKTIEWGDLYKILYLYKEDTDYIMYDRRRSLPIRKSIGYGTYVIKSIDDDVVDNNLDEYITITLHDDLKYKLFDETIEKYLQVGDELVTYDDSAKMQIVSINTITKQIKIKILNGDYLNLVADPDGNLSSDMSKLKFYSAIDYDLDKYINIPLEEDQYIAIFVAPIHPYANIQSSWGRGIYVNTNEIRLDIDANTRFSEYYEKNVKNIGDILYEITAASTSTIMKYSEDEFKAFTQYSPTIDTTKLQVVQINSHINDSETVKNIRQLYDQKQDCHNKLQDIENEISSINRNLAEISFTDTSGIRETYESQLLQYQTKRDSLLNNIAKLSKEMSSNANNSEIPLENAKYHIRGYYNWLVQDENTDAILAKYWKHVVGIKVQYRYRNKDNNTGSARSIDDNFIFSDWNMMDSFQLQRIPMYDSGYKFGYPEYTGVSGVKSQDNGRLNEPSFNQIDIPISQGETVDIRLKIVWDFGYPFMETTSNWSPIVNINFPVEFLRDIQLTEILDENAKDLDDERFRNYLNDHNVIEHVSDQIMDQNVRFFHKASSISSGFYTPERRIIPLDEKLKTINDTVIELKDIINGTDVKSLTCTFTVDGLDNTVIPGRKNTITLPPYSSTSVYSGSKPFVIQGTIQIANNTEHIAHIHSLFPASSEKPIGLLTNTKFIVGDYQPASTDGVYIGYPGSNVTTNFKLQTSNQWLTFRIKDVYDGTEYYKANDTSTNPLNNIATAINNLNTGDGIVIYPYMQDEGQIKIEGGAYDYLTLNPGESVMLPIMMHYRITGNNTSFVRYLSFDIRTSLYQDPINYLIEIVANNTDSVQETTSKIEKSKLVNKSVLSTATLKKSKYNTVIKNA